MSRRRRLPQVAFFCTMGGSGAQRVFDAMAAVSGKQPLATLALTDRDIDKRRHGRIDTFVHALATPVRPAARTARRHRARARAVPAHAS
jgi:hypothetical protein